MKDFYFQKDKWWVSPYNFVDEVREEYNLPKKRADPGRGFWHTR
jgi:hypothetical protein